MTNRCRFRLFVRQRQNNFSLSGGERSEVKEARRGSSDLARLYSTHFLCSPGIVEPDAPSPMTAALLFFLAIQIVDPFLKLRDPLECVGKIPRENDDPGTTE